ncbi:MAG: sugar ABC transporter permease [Eubacteriales bacterium]|nr:sugar ABC transporter permease [Eubacteriales bacterium]MDD3504169.1 sugar ABC transporter permease [Eubacteriales bacterium]MDD4682477.1 sugar ABC transporter permease [Eubacteriales bacterium]
MSPASTRSLSSRQRSIIGTAALFLIPAFVVLGVYMFYSIFDSFRLSLVDWNGVSPDKTFVGLANWQELIGDARFRLALLNNFKVVIFSILIQLPIGMLLAFFLDTAGKKANVFKVIWFLPLLMSSVAIGFLFKYIYDPAFGLISPLSRMLGGKNIDLLGNPSLALFAVIIVICWQFIPFYMVYFLAGLSSLPVEIYEAAIIDGATRARYFTAIALPMLKNTFINAVILSMVGSLKYFDLIYVMTEGGPSGSTELMATYMFKNAFTTMRMGYGSTVASAMFLIITFTSLITMNIMRRGGDK